MENLLIGCIRKRTSREIQTRFFFLNSGKGEIKDVTEELVTAIEQLNAHNKELRKKTNEYHLIIPYEYKEGLAAYSFGCGNTHYLQENCFNEIVEKSKNTLSFPLTTCRITVFSPDDIKHILKCKNAWDIGITDALLARYSSKMQSK